MNIVLTARHFELTDGLREYAEDRASRLRRYNDRLSRLEITLVEEKREKRAEARASIDGDIDIHAEAGAEDFRVAVRRVTDKLARQLKRRREVRHKHQAPRLGRDIEPIRLPEGSED